jgi:hypothetical protein
MKFLRFDGLTVAGEAIYFVESLANILAIEDLLQWHDLLLWQHRY